MADDKKIFLEEDELSEVREIRNQSLSTFMKLGKVRVELDRYIKESDKKIREYEGAEEALLKEHQELSEKENRFINKISEKYGDGELNPETGEFIPTK